MRCRRNPPIATIMVALILMSLVIIIFQAVAHNRTQVQSPSIPRPYLPFSSPRHTWVCQNASCRRVERNKDVTHSDVKGLPLNVCKLNCGYGGALWPLPTGKIQIGKETLEFYPQQLEFSPFQAEPPIVPLLEETVKIFRSNLVRMHPEYVESPGSSLKFPVDNADMYGGYTVTVSIGVAWPDRSLTLKSDESYTLALAPAEDGRGVIVSIIANTYFGARHGLETLSQLIAFNDYTGTLSIVKQVVITDKPAFKYRGILIDTARSFISIPALKRLIDGLSYNKLNIMHWHITDSQSFPFESTRRPIMTEYGAYSPRHIYRVDEMKELVEYGRIRGVKVLPEFDAPAHVGSGWEWGPSEGLGNLVACFNKEPWHQYCVEPPCGQFNVVNENVYKVLGDLYLDFLDIFESDIFHMGGDEVHANCWNSTKEITDWMKNNGYGTELSDFINLWGSFQRKAYEKLKEANNRQDLDAILWTSHLTNEEHILKHISNSTYIIQIWTNGEEEGKIIPFLIKNGYRTIFSNVDPWYLDCGYGAWVGSGKNNWCSPYKGWQQVYMHNPIKVLANSTGDEYAQEAYKNGFIVGGEAPLWTEQADASSMDSKIWPRGSALAERLWTNPTTNWFAAERRMLRQRQRLVTRGLQPDQLQPDWCYQNEGSCVL